MTSTTSISVDVADVRLGMYIRLEVGWMHHPFAVGRFKVVTPAQLQTLRQCGVARVSLDISRSDPDAIAAWRQAHRQSQLAEAVAAVAADMHTEADSALALAQDLTAQIQEAQYLAEQASCAQLGQVLKQPVERFVLAADRYQDLCCDVQAQPLKVAKIAKEMVHGYVSELMDSSDTMLCLLAGRAGDHTAAHPVNVTILCLLLGKAMGMSERALQDLGMAALLHDMGKVQLPPACQHDQPHLLQEERERYISHVGASVALAQAMGLSPDVSQYIAQHHELLDGTGFPLGLMGDELMLCAQMLAMVNAYDHLCNPHAHVAAHTPHEALSVLFAQRRHHFQLDLIKAFVRMMGVYPPGTVVQLSDGRYGLVVGVNALRPLKPQVMVHDLRVGSGPSAVLDLESTPGLAIKRSLRPDQLPRDALEYLSPQRRICYFFERAVDITAQRKVP